MSAAEPEAGRRRTLGEAWPIAAAAGLVLGALVAVWAMLHPRHAESAAESGIPATVTVAGTELRDSPSPKANAVAPVAEGARLRVLAESGRWAEVETDAGRHGFVEADDLESDADRAARQRRSKTLLAFAPVYGVVADEADVVLAPYPLAARGGRLAKGTVVAIHAVDHSYFAFADKKWGIAFVESARVDLVPPDPRQPGVTPEKLKPLADLTVIDLEAEPPPEEEAPADAAEEAPAAAAPTPAVPAEPAPGLLEPAAVLTRVEPAYPDVARRAGIEGTVELEVSIDGTGKVTDVEVVRGLPLGMSDAAASAVRRWTFRPARTAAGPVTSRKTVRIRFVLGPDAPR